MFDRLVRRNLLGFVAIFLALGGISFAAVKLKPNSVKSKQIKDGSIRGVDVGDNALTGADIDEGSLSGMPAGPQGPRGATGPAGAGGVDGLDGADGTDGATGPSGVGVANLGFARTVLDSNGFVGSASSVTIGTDGLALISYSDSGNGDLKVAHCSDPTCSAATFTALDGATTNVGGETSITVGPDGLGLIAYRDTTNGDLKVAHCSNVLCSSATLNTVDGGVPSVGDQLSLTIGSDGLGLIAYRDVTNLDLKVAHCSNATCSSATVTTLDAPTDLGREPSTTIGTDGLALISYRENIPANDLKVAHCSNLVCDAATISTVETAGAVGVESSITTGSDGRGLISFHDNSASALRVAHCSNPNCTAVTTATLDTGGGTGRDSSLTIGSDGLGVVAYADSGGDLGVAHCSDIECTAGTSTTVDSDAGSNPAVTVGPDGMPLVSYLESGASNLRVAHCSSRLCVPFHRQR